MRIILVYDISNHKNSKVMKLCQMYLNHVQNSVFEGELTVSYLKELIEKLRKIINKEKDSILIYTISNPKWMNKEIIGIEKNEISNFL
jgi:CRISPR-associated protein Cas2